MGMRMFVVVGAILIAASCSAGSSDTDSVQLPKGLVLEAPLPQRSPDAQARLQHGRRVVFSEDFENPPYTWSMNGSWQIGNPGSGPGSGHDSPACAATALDGNYGNNADDWLVSPGIALPSLPQGQAHIVLAFWEWYSLESGYDDGNIHISTDDGWSWTQLGSRDGSSDWRETTIDLTGYANQVIRLGFQLDTDGSVVRPGWYVDDVEIFTVLPDPLSVTCLSINSQNFPFLYVSAAVETSGVGCASLDASSFSISEDGELQLDYWEVVPPDTGGGVRLADIVFLMDNSGSMDDEIEDVSNNVLDFVDNLTASGVDFALGLCRFGQSSGSGWPQVQDNGILTTDAMYFKYDVWARNEATGGFEPGWDALWESVNSFSFRPGASRFFILITDETPSDDGNVGNVTQADAITALRGANVTTFCFVDFSDGHANTDYCYIADETNGMCFDILTPMDDVLDVISSSISDTYVLKYKSSNPVSDGSTRHVVVTVEHDGHYDDCELSYSPGSAPSIERTPETIALHDQSWAETTPLTIAVNIYDQVQPYVQSATLYYRRTGDPGYSHTWMTNSSGSTWQATVPGSAVHTPGLDYYISATDGASTSTDPAVDPSVTPYQIAILPNVAPEIDHNPVLTTTPGAAVPIIAEISDNTNSLSSAELFYRKTGELLYHTAVMTSSYDDIYLAEIPSAYSTDEGVEYYIRATDDLGVAATCGTVDRPVEAFPLLQYGFARDPDAWGFGNNESELWPDGAGVFPSWEDFSEAFDASDLSPGAHLYHLLLVMIWKGTWPGSCYGMSYTSQLIFDGWESLEEMPWTTESALWDIKSANGGSRDYINQHWLYQFGAEQLALSGALALEGSREYTSSIHRLRYALRTGNSAAIALFWRDSQDRICAHSITPLSLAKSSESPERYRIMTYDNSGNTYDRELQVDVTDHSWIYNGPFSIARTSNFWLDVPTALQTDAPIIPVQPSFKEPSTSAVGDSLLPRSRLDEILVAAVDENVDILLQAETGSLGYWDGSVVRTMPDAVEFYPLASEASYERPPLYILEEQDVDCRLRAEDEAGYEFFAFRPGVALHVDKQTSAQGEEDYLSMRADLAGMRFSAAGDREPMSADVIRVTSDTEAAVGIRGLRPTAGDTIAIRVADHDGDFSDDVIFENAGGRQSLELQLDYFDGIEETHFLTTAFPVDSLCICYFHPNWDSLGTAMVAVVVDDGMDGQMDDTLHIRNQYSPETGSLSNDNIYFYPNPYNPDGDQMGLIRYSLTQDGDVTIKIYDVSGSLVRTLLEDEPVGGGLQLAEEWDGKNEAGDIVANGVYFYVVESGSGDRGVGKIAVLR
ncbi:MAG: choice-of-anchor J domain-containing protein [Candidatus Eisenbacteria bacterium]|nr:choice-of-anchor J domain-containing protein [Candidatus Eisenbacteria bacterium]